MPNARTTGGNRRRARRVPKNSGDYITAARDVARAVADARKTVQEVKSVVRDARRDPKGTVKRAAKSLVREFFGHGDYTTGNLNVKYNSLINPAPGSVTGPRVSNDGRRGVTFRQREFIRDIVSGPTGAPSTSFDNVSEAVNPSNPALFPWLSNVAPLFDQWCPDGIVFYYKSTSSTFNGTSQALGAIGLAGDYDQADPAYASMQELNQSDYAVSVVASSSVAYGVECDPNERPTALLFTDYDTGASLTARNLCNLLTFQIATQGMTVEGVTLGQLWVEYDITFYKKQMPPVTLVPRIYLNYRFGSQTIDDTMTWLAGVKTVSGLIPVAFDGTHLIFNNMKNTRFLLIFQVYSPSHAANVDLINWGVSSGYSFQPGDAVAGVQQGIGFAACQVSSFTCSADVTSLSVYAPFAEWHGRRILTIVPIEPSAGLYINVLTA